MRELKKKSLLQPYFAVCQHYYEPLKNLRGNWETEAERRGPSVFDSFGVTRLHVLTPSISVLA